MLRAEQTSALEPHDNTLNSNHEFQSESLFQPVYTGTDTATGNGDTPPFLKFDSFG